MGANPGTERMRFMPSPVHTDGQIADLIAALKEAACPVGSGEYVRLAAESASKPFSNERTSLRGGICTQARSAKVDYLLFPVRCF